jgi:phosphohistidine swiveling domain-containing protein
MATISLTSTAAAVAAPSGTPTVGGVGSTYKTTNFQVSISTNGLKATLANGSAISYPITRTKAQELALAILRLAG